MDDPQFTFDYHDADEVDAALREPAGVAGEAPRPGERPKPTPVMFWLLVLMACSVFTPCIILPVWRDYDALCYAAQLERSNIAQLRSRLDEQRRHIDALRSDPMVVRRAAQRELAYRAPGSRLVRLEVPPPRAISIDAAKGAGTGRATYGTKDKNAPLARRLADAAPPAARWFVQWWRRQDRLDVFCSRRTRPLLMGMSLTLVAFAFALFPPARSQRPRR